jgi:Cft2 family RNA processing exonuclease
MEALHADERIALRDLHTVYEALFLRAVTSFEGYLEELFISIVKQRVRYKRSRGVSVLIQAASNEALLEILLQGAKYMQWLPYEYTEKRARLYLKDGKPFCDLNDGDKSKIKTISTIRNAIAHKSEYAMREFNRTVIGNQALLRGEKRPAGYLRSQVSANTGHNRFMIYIAELARIAETLT